MEKELLLARSCASVTLSVGKREVHIHWEKLSRTNVLDIILSSFLLSTS